MSENLTPRQLKSIGRKAFEKGEYLEAAEAFLAAAQKFQATGDLLAAAEMANNRSVALLQAGDAEVALEAVEGTDETFARAGDVRRQAMALGNRAAALQAQGHYDQAEETYRQSAELLKQLGETELRAAVMSSISELQMRKGQYLEAAASLHAGLSELQEPTSKQRLIRKLLEMPSKILNR